MASESSLSGSLLPADPTSPLGAATMQYVDVRVPLVQNDQVHYGDYWSTMPRQLSTQTRSLTVGTALYCCAVAADTFTATKLRVFSGTASAGTGTFRATIYTGTVLTSLAPQASITNQTSVSAGALLEFTLSGSVAVTPGLIVCAAFLTTGFSTPPTFQALPQGGGPAAFISPGGSSTRWVALSASGQTALPTSTVSMASMTQHGNPMWCSLAP